MSLPAPAPRVDAESAPFWAAGLDGRLLLHRCDACGYVVGAPRIVCPACRATTLSYTAASGRGTVYSFTIVRRGAGAYGDAAPYVLAYVECAEGPRLMTNIVGCPPESVRIGQAVEVVFDDTGGGTALPRFRAVQEG